VTSTAAQLAGQTAVVTGGSAGIGPETARLARAAGRPSAEEESR
jgi:NAD(P)-dependent dehydrogenase (short-subunit alcohol dehydrogenase family)